MDKPIKMGKFFDSVHHDYDEVHTSHIDNGKEFYIAISRPVKPTEERVRVLNIGCGTGLEFESILEKIPNAEVDCIDLSFKMLNLLEKRLKNSSCKLNSFCCSYLDFNYQNSLYDYAIASATLHHLLNDEKLNIYSKLIMSLKNSGILIIGDKFAPSDEAANLKLAEYQEYINNGIDVKSGQYHIDIPTTFNNEQILLNDTGFKNVEKIWFSRNYTIITAKKQL